MFGEEDVLRFDVSVDALQEKQERLGLTEACVEFVVSRWHINSCSVEGKGILVKKKKRKKRKVIKLVSLVGTREKRRRRYRDGRRTEERKAYVLFVTEVDGLQRLPRDALGELLRDSAEVNIKERSH